MDSYYPHDWQPMGSQSQGHIEDHYTYISDTTNHQVSFRLDTPESVGISNHCSPWVSRPTWRTAEAQPLPAYTFPDFGSDAFYHHEQPQTDYASNNLGYSFFTSEDDSRPTTQSPHMTSTGSTRSNRFFTPSTQRCSSSENGHDVLTPSTSNIYKRTATPYEGRGPTRGDDAGTAGLGLHHGETVEFGSSGLATRDAEVSDPCYAQLLWTCLMQAPNHELSLRELYSWVAANSPKARDSASKGWQNSVRHNLSMNAGFEKVPVTLGKGSVWRLTNEAVRNGVESTTRYRKQPKRKSPRSSKPAPKRVTAGAKGGQASRRAALANKRRLNTASANNSKDDGGPSIDLSGQGPSTSRLHAPHFVEEYATALPEPSIYGQSRHSAEDVFGLPYGYDLTQSNASRMPLLQDASFKDYMLDAPLAMPEGLDFDFGYADTYSMFLEQ